MQSFFFLLHWFFLHGYTNFWNASLTFISLFLYENKYTNIILTKLLILA